MIKAEHSLNKKRKLSRHAVRRIRAGAADKDKRAKVSLTLQTKLTLDPEYWLSPL